MTELEPLRRRVRELEDQFRNLLTGEGWSVGIFQDEGVPGHWELNYRKKNQGGEGACCFPDGSCSVLTVQECREAGGTFLANGTTCSPNPCSDFCVGACCRDDGSCDIQRESICVSGGGTWQGCGTDCVPNPCPAGGACCVGTSCTVTSSAHCTDIGGTYHGDGTTCDDVDCSQGACCTDGVCSITTEEDCGGNYLGDGTTCDDVDCTTGACCVGEVCSIETSMDCAGMGGTYQGDGTTCITDICRHCSCSHFINPHAVDKKKWLSRVGMTSVHLHEHVDMEFGCTTIDGDITATATKTEDINSLTCVLTSSCSGSAHQEVITNPHGCISECSEDYDPCSSGGSCFGLCVLLSPGFESPPSDPNCLGGVTGLVATGPTITSGSDFYTEHWDLSGLSGALTGSWDNTVNYSNQCMS